MSVELFIHEIEGKGFWVEVVEVAFWVIKIQKYIKSDGSLGVETPFAPDWVISDGLFNDKDAAILAANQYAGIRARAEGKWSLPVRY